ncbi:MAG TPA: metalloregulator ArsR/SmtB family transcription factor [Nitrososphaerales archaeon]|nr:metalloregulator ArsR/SmtB family transcription factor [Nitrososphaerales archaeon]
MSKADYQAKVLLFKVLSNHIRLKLIEALRGGEKDVTELCRVTREEQTRVSHELRCLTVCGFANFRREGKRMIYSLNSSKTVIAILDAAENHVEHFGERMKGCDMISEAQKMTISVRS